MSLHKIIMVSEKDNLRMIMWLDKYVGTKTGYGRDCLLWGSLSFLFKMSPGMRPTQLVLYIKCNYKRLKELPV